MDESDEKSFCQPEMLSHGHIMGLLKEAGVNINGYETKSKEDLITEFYKIACPLPQRKYRNNRRGRKMTINQIQVSKRKRTHSQISTVSNEKGESYTIASSTGNHKKDTQSLPKCGLVNEFNFLSTMKSHNVKPPQTLIDPNKKVVKLGGLKSPISNLTEVRSKCINNERQKITFATENRTSTNISVIEGSKPIHKGSFSSENMGSQIIKKAENETNKSIGFTSEKQSSASPSRKIKLKRSGEIKIPSTEEIHSAVDSKTNNKTVTCDPVVTNEISKIEIAMDESPPKNGMNTDRSKQRQINFINSTLQKRAAHDVEHPFPGQKKTTNPITPKEKSKPVQSDNKIVVCDKETKLEEEGVVAKKFKRISIGWP